MQWPLTFPPGTKPLTCKFTCTEMAPQQGAMTQKRHTEEQMIAVLKDAQEGIGGQELWRKRGISDATFYKWRAKYVDRSQ